MKITNIFNFLFLKVFFCIIIKLMVLKSFKMIMINLIGNMLTSSTSLFMKLTWSSFKSLPSLYDICFLQSGLIKPGVMKWQGRTWSDVVVWIHFILKHKIENEKKQHQIYNQIFVLQILWLLHEYQQE